MNDTSWSVALSLSFPLFKGGEKAAVRARTSKELEQLRLQREALAERIEERIRAALHLTGASHISITQARKAAKSAEDSLEVIRNAYELGAVTILRLLDAQNAVYNAQQNAADAVYSFLIDLMEMERAIGRFEFFMGDEERQAFLGRMRAYFERSGFPIECP
jgi:outer membrane protein TolC